MQIIKAALPVNSVLNIKKYDYIDSFQGELIDKDSHFTSIDVARAFFTSAPKWVEKLFDFRNKVVSVFGLKTPGDMDNRQKQLADFKFEPGTQLGLFKVFHKSVNEIVLGEDDKHLNFRISLFLGPIRNDQRKILTISTSVEFNNWFGRLYFLPVRPLHGFIVPAMLKGIIRELEKK